MFSLRRGLRTAPPPPAGSDPAKRHSQVMPMGPVGGVRDLVAHGGQKLALGPVALPRSAPSR